MSIKNNNIYIYSLLIGIGLLFSSCSLSQTYISTDNPPLMDDERKELQESLPPLHPPIVLPYTWKEGKQKE